MGTLSTSNLKSVSVYRQSDTDLLVGDLMEVSLSGTTGYVSSKIDLGSLKDWIIGEGMTPHQPFDIFYRTIKSTPLAYTTDLSGNRTPVNTAGKWSAWPLFIDSSVTTTDNNTVAPNWIGKWSGTTANKVSSSYPSLWNELSGLAGSFTTPSTSAILVDIVDSTNALSINSSPYMIEYSSQGYTGRFLIDINGYVALPILNESFIRTVAKSGSSVGTSELDEFKSHLHTTNNRTGNSIGTTAGYNVPYNSTGTPYSTGLSGGLETRPKNVRYCPYMQIMNSLPALAEGHYEIPYATTAEVSATFNKLSNTSSLQMSASITPLELYNAFSLSGTTGTQLLSTNGFQKFPGGMIIQWGSFNDTILTTSSIPFPITFPNMILTGSASTGGAGYPLAIIDWTNTTTSALKFSAFNFIGASYITKWFVIGL